MTNTSPDIDPDTLRAFLTEYGDEIRHYSSVRSALTTFLLTVSLAAFSAYFDSGNGRSDFFWIAGGMFLLASLIACVHFSYETEKKAILYKKVRNALRANSPLTSCDLELSSAEYRRARGKVLRDPLNWLLLVGGVALGGAFLYFYSHLPVK